MLEHLNDILENTQITASTARRTISYQLRAWRYYRCRKTISPQGTLVCGPLP